MLFCSHLCSTWQCFCASYSLLLLLFYQFQIFFTNEIIFEIVKITGPLLKPLKTLAFSKIKIFIFWYFVNKKWVLVPRSYLSPFSTYFTWNPLVSWLKLSERKSYRKRTFLKEQNLICCQLKAKQFFKLLLLRRIYWKFSCTTLFYEIFAIMSKNILNPAK